MAEEESIFDECVDVFQRYGRYLLSDPNCDVKSEYENISLPMMEVCDARDRYKIVKNVHDVYDRDPIEESSNGEIKSLLNTINTAIQTSFEKMESSENNKTFLQFKKSFTEKDSLDDSDVATLSQHTNTIDPITKLPMTFPVKNVKCGHVYEHSSIYELVRRKKLVKCPIPGCSAVDRVRLTDLVPDEELKRYLDSIRNT